MIDNRIANYNYNIVKTIEAGIVLKGTEVKSICEGMCNLKTSFIIIKDNEVFLVNAHIAKYNNGSYNNGSYNNHEETRMRKLLFTKKQIRDLIEHRNKDKYSIVPMKLYDNGKKFKLIVGIGKGKNKADKRESIKKRDIDRELRKEY